MMENIKLDLFEKNVKVKTIYGNEFEGIFTDNFSDYKEIVVGGVLIKYNEVEEMVAINK